MRVANCSSGDAEREVQFAQVEQFLSHERDYAGRWVTEGAQRVVDLLEQVKRQLDDADLELLMCLRARHLINAIEDHRHVRSHATKVRRIEVAEPAC